MADQESGTAGGCEQPYDFEMPTAREIELDLALGSPGWQGLLASREPSPPHMAVSNYALRTARRRQASEERRP